MKDEKPPMMDVSCGEMLGKGGEWSSTKGVEVGQLISVAVARF